MNAENILVDQIKRYLLENPINRSQQNPYNAVAKHFDVSSERIRNIYRRLRKKGLVENSSFFMQRSGTVLETPCVLTTSNGTYSYIETGDTATIKQTIDYQVKTLDDLINTCDIDTNEWEVSTWSCKKWDLGIKNKQEEIETKQLYSVSANLKKRKLDKDIQKQKNEVLSEIKDYLANIVVPEKIRQGIFEKEYLLEISVPDIHFGKLSWKDETGEDYDIKIASQRYKDAIHDIISKTPTDIVDRILFPIGNDMINIDSRHNMTTAGTPQDSDSRFKKILLTVKNLLVEVINELSEIAPVDVVVVSGNHDYDTMFTMGMVIEAFFSNNPNVTVDNSPKQRKYYQYHNNGLMFTHGNEEKHNDLGLIFATENTKLWGDTKFREVHLGHFHKNKKLNFTSVDEFQGFQVVIIPSLSGTDFWHKSKGYNSLKQAKGFLYHKEKGKEAEFTYSI